MLSRVSFAVLAVVCLSACSGDSSTDPGGDPGGGKPTLTITGSQSAEVGAQTQLAAQAKDAKGADVPSPPIQWSSSNPTVIDVSGAGVVTATRIGTATITATWNGTTATQTFTSNLTPYTFSLTGVSEADAQIIRDGVQYAHTFFKTTFNRAPTQATTITGSTTAQGCVQAGGGGAFTGRGAITFCVANPGWTMLPGNITKQKVVQHEFFHVLQFEMGWTGGPPNTQSPTWLIEGAAELVSFQVLASLNKMPFTTAIGCQVKESYDFGVRQPPGLPNLIALESQQQWGTTVGPTYTIAMLGSDQLTTGRGLNALITYGAAVASGTPWPTAFQNAFGTTPAAFYAQFPSYRAGLPVPPEYLCRV